MITEAEFEKIYRCICPPLGSTIKDPLGQKRFMEERGLKRCRKEQSIAGLLGYQAEEDFPWFVFDHQELYEKDGKSKTLVLHPYKGNINNLEECVDELRCLCEKYNLDLEVNPCDTWYNPGRCHVIVLTRRSINQ